MNNFLNGQTYEIYAAVIDNKIVDLFYGDQLVNKENCVLIGKTNDHDFLNKIHIFDSNGVANYAYIDGQIIERTNVEKMPDVLKLTRAELRRSRERKCFSIVNRGAVWYDNLSDVQKNELQMWYQAWLDVTNTLSEPVTPSWL